MTKRLSLLVALGLLSATAPMVPTAQAAGPRVVTVQAGTRNILVDGQPFVAKGFNYVPDSFRAWPQGAFADDPAACAADAPLLKSAGVTAVRIWWITGAGSSLPADEIACLDALYANGVSVIWTISYGARPFPGWSDAYKLIIDEAVKRFRNHPATLMYLLGNEWEHQCGNVDHVACVDQILGKPGTVGLLNEVIAYTRAKDPNHLVGTTICCPIWDLPTYNLPDLQVWSLNWYPFLFSAAGVNQFANELNSLTTWDPDRPKIFTEMGIDRFHCNVSPSQPVAGWSTLCKTGTGLAPPATSGEYQQPQAQFFGKAWDMMATHINTSGSSDLSGATFFMFNDMWNKCSIFCGGSGTGQTHETANEGVTNAPDGYSSAEWWGVTHANPYGSTYKRATTLAFDALARRWSPLPVPTITSGPTLSPQSSPCTYDGGQQYRIRATWTTDVPTSSEVYYSIPGEVLTGGGDMLQDNSIYQPKAYDATLTTNHSIAFDTTLGRGSVIIRSFTASGQSVTHPPMKITCGDV